MSTRAGTAFTSNRAKQNLIKLLFQEGSTKSQHSYQNLRKAYLQKLQEMHPDKFAHEGMKIRGENDTNALKSHDTSTSISSYGKFERNAQFVELQNAWKHYEGFAKQHRMTPRPKKGHAVEEVQEANFTMFGVGCSFADSPEERRYRNEIMDQASRGWFSSGALTEKEDHSNSSTKMESPSKQERISLCDDDLFVSNNGESNEKNGKVTQLTDPPPLFSSQLNAKYNPAIFTKKCLVDMPFTRRKLYTHHGFNKSNQK